MAMRRTYIIDWRVQGSYMLMTAVSVLLTGLSVAVAMYCLLFSSFTEQMGAANLAKLNFRIMVPGDAGRIVGIAIGIIVLSILTGLFFVFYTHRVVGPWKRIQSAFDAVQRGDYSVRLRVRKNDCMKSIIESFNAMADSLQKSKR